MDNPPDSPPGNTEPNQEQPKSPSGRFVLKYDLDTVKAQTNAIREATEKQWKKKYEESIRDANQKQANEQARSNRLEAISNRITIHANRISRSALIASSIATIFALGAVIFTGIGANAANNTLNENRREFNINHRAQLDVNETVIYRGSWRGLSDKAQLTYDVVNITDNPIQIDYVKHKWDCNPLDYSKFSSTNFIDTFREKVDFSSIDSMITVSKSAVRPMQYTKPDKVNFAITDYTYSRDSPTIYQNQSMLITEVYYTNVFTKEKLKFMFIGKVRSSGSGELRDLKENIMEIFYRRVEPADEEK